jgi:hypothetical protein
MSAVETLPKTLLVSVLPSLPVLFVCLQWGHTTARAAILPTNAQVGLSPTCANPQLPPHPDLQAACKVSVRTLGFLSILARQIRYMPLQVLSYGKVTSRSPFRKLTVS